jgi:hypothetical protein
LALLLLVFNGGQSIAALTHVIIPTETIPRAVAATGIGLAAMFAELISATVGPAVGMTLSKTYGLPATMWAGAGALVVVPSASGFDPAAPARSYRVGSGTTRSKPLRGDLWRVCALAFQAG